jgi:hypothetical protein
MFLNVTMLAGIAGALVPVILHLLSRSRYRTVDWGGMMFLEGADARVMQSARLKQWVILLMRMAMVGLLAMALAQPVMRGRWGGLARDGGRVSAVIVLDCSASMQFDENGKSRMELARTAVLNILESLKDNRAAVILAGAKEPELLAQPTADLQKLAQRAMTVSEPSGRADLPAALERAVEILDSTGETTRELYVVCDRQASNWREIEGHGGIGPDWRGRLERGGTLTRFFVVPVGSEKEENLAIEAVELVNAPAIRDQSAEVEVRVRNYGQMFRGNVEVKLEDRGTPVQAATVSVGPDAAASVRFAMKWPQAGSRLLTATLGAGGPKFDDKMQASVEVVDPIRVLVVSGDERGASSPLQSESDFLRIALAPRTAEARQKRVDVGEKTFGDPFRVEVEPIERWNEDELKKYQVVVLANVPQLTPTQSTALEQFVYEGGGLWVAPGNLSRVENYNSQLYRGGSGIAPVHLGTATAEDGSEATTLQGISDFDHPVFRFLKGRPDPVPLVTVGRYFPADPRTREGKVLAQYASGKPFLVASTVGRGRVLVMTTPLDADWGTLPLSNFYLPFVQSAARYLASGQVGERNILPGKPIVARFGAEVKKATVYPPPDQREGKNLPVTRGEVRYANTQQPGLYVVIPNDDRSKRVHFVVQTPRVESDLTPLTVKQWKDLATTLGFERIEPSRESITAAVTAARGGRELWLSLVGTVIVLSIVEMAVIRRWTEGGAA